MILLISLVRKGHHTQLPQYYWLSSLFWTLHPQVHFLKLQLALKRFQPKPVFSTQNPHVDLGFCYSNSSEWRNCSRVVSCPETGSLASSPNIAYTVTVYSVLGNSPLNSISVWVSPIFIWKEHTLSDCGPMCIIHADQSGSG